MYSSESYGGGLLVVLVVHRIAVCNFASQHHSFSRRLIVYGGRLPIVVITDDMHNDKPLHKPRMVDRARQIHLDLLFF